MVFINRNFKDKGLKEIWIGGIQIDCDCKFRKFSSWGVKQNIDFYLVFLVDCVDFLIELYKEDLQYRIVVGYRYMFLYVLYNLLKILNRDLYFV